MVRSTSLKRAQQKYQNNLVTIRFRLNPKNPADAKALELWNSLVQKHGGRKKTFIQALEMLTEKK